MVTFVGTQSKFADVLRDLLELDYEAKEAYEAAINRIENRDYRHQLETFRDDHQAHITEIKKILEDNNEDLPIFPTTKQWLTKGKVILGEIIGDSGILRAMKSNEIDTNTAYERIADRDDIWPDAEKLVQQGLTDEKKHKKWLEETIEDL